MFFVLGTSCIKRWTWKHDAFGPRQDQKLWKCYLADNPNLLLWISLLYLLASLGCLVIHYITMFTLLLKKWECRGQSLKSVVCLRPQSKERHLRNEKVKSASLHSWLSLLSSLLHSSWHTCSPKRTPSGIPPWTMCVLTTWTTPCPTTGSLLHTTRKNPAHIITSCQALPVVSGPWENWSLASALENL